MKLILSLLLSLIVAYACSCILTIFVNPEVTFWNEAISRRLDDIASIREKQPGQPMIIFTGSSSCAFSIDPEIIEKTTGLPTINLGLPGAAGARFTLHQALRQAKPGDIIIYSTPADILTFPNQESSPARISFALEARRGIPTEAAGGSTFGKPLLIAQYFTLSRPGVDYLIILAGRKISGKGYRYKLPDIRNRGLIQTPVREKSMQPVGPRTAITLNSEGRQLLETFIAAATQKGVHVAYSMPLTYTATAELAQSRAANQQLLANIKEIMPVIEDGYSGAIDNIENFSDSQRHLSERGSKIRSQALARALQLYLKN